MGATHIQGPGGNQSEQAVMPEFDLDFQEDSDDFDLDGFVSEAPTQEQVND